MRAAWPSKSGIYFEWLRVYQARHQPVHFRGNDKTLFTFDKDSGSQRNYKDACLAQWPAYRAALGAKLRPDLGLTSDGKQWTHRGQPLYFVVGDQNTGERRGNRAGNGWHAIPAEGQTKTNDATQPKSAF
jgi:predicted lipoprotein with Yx(FWY)xxD motif